MIFPNLCEEATFRSKFPLEESVSILSGKVREDCRKNRWGNGLLGTVRPDEVVLRYFRFWNKSSGIVRFRGSFKEKDGAVVLSGRFEMLKSERNLFCSWFAITILLFCYPFLFLRGESRIHFLILPISALVLWIGCGFYISIIEKRNMEDMSHAITSILDYGANIEELS
jgi:hypothetical protein